MISRSLHVSCGAMLVTLNIRLKANFCRRSSVSTPITRSLFQNQNLRTTEFTNVKSISFWKMTLFKSWSPKLTMLDFHKVRSFGDIESHCRSLARTHFTLWSISMWAVKLCCMGNHSRYALAMHLQGSF